MAIMYIGDKSNTPKEIKNFYIGVDGIRKTVIGGWIGVKDTPKLFYFGVGNDVYLKTIQGITSIFYRPLSQIDGPGATYKGLPTETWYGSSGGTSKLELCIPEEANNVYLNENSSLFIDDYNFFSEDDIVLNLENFKFNYVKNLYGSFGFEYVDGKGTKVIGNISKLNLNNVINMSVAFYNTKITGTYFSGPNTTNMYSTYENTKYLRLPFACGSKVTNLVRTYRNCRIYGGANNEINIGPAVTNCAYAYWSIYPSSASGITQFYLNKVYTKASNLAGCFYNVNIKGDIYLSNSSANIQYIFGLKQGTGIINIHYPKGKITELNTTLSSKKIVNSSETHQIVSSTYIDILSSSGSKYNVRIYADYVES